MSKRFLKPLKKASQDLSAGALDYTTDYGTQHPVDVMEVEITFSQAVTETDSVTRDSKTASTHDSLKDSYDLVSESEYTFRLQGKMMLYPGDKLKVGCTNANLVGIAYMEIRAREAS